MTSWRLSTCGATARKRTIVRGYGEERAVAALTAAKAKSRDVPIDVMPTCSMEGVRVVPAGRSGTGLRIPLPDWSEVEGKLHRNGDVAAVRVVVAPRAEAGRSSRPPPTSPARSCAAWPSKGVWRSASTRSSRPRGLRRGHRSTHPTHRMRRSEAEPHEEERFRQGMRERRRYVATALQDERCCVRC